MTLNVTFGKPLSLPIRDTGLITLKKTASWCRKCFEHVKVLEKPLVFINNNNELKSILLGVEPGTFCMPNVFFPALLPPFSL